MNIVTSDNPALHTWNNWKQQLDEKSTPKEQNATITLADADRTNEAPAAHTRKAGDRDRFHHASHLTRHKHDSRRPSPGQTPIQAPAQPPVQAQAPVQNTAGTTPPAQNVIWTTLTEVPRSPTGAPVTHEFENGNVKITSSPLHQGSFNGTPTTRNKVTIETGNQDDHIEIKTLQSGAVVAEINEKAYALPIENHGAILGQLEIKTNGGNDQVNIDKKIWFETSISLNDDHHISGRDHYTSAPESANKKTFFEPGVIPVPFYMTNEGDSQVFNQGDVTISFTQNNHSDYPGDGVTVIKTGDGDDKVRISAADDGSLIADINEEKFLLPVKNDPTGRSRLFIQTREGNDSVIIDSNVKNFSYINLGAEVSGTVYMGGGFVSGPEEAKQDQQYRNQNYNPLQAR
ncbi:MULTISPECIES: hypothetical protein [Pseudomonas fluorescens group]|uniref:Uncharacterized protein n=1 Tax=Pseudomonas fluorescens TaxID=294 RepID=A0A0D0SFC2_PSEFL|nr:MULTISPECIES: hypothetical protein [Pseudomonas fluorescens group]AZE59836.1 hypothetical protein C4K02_1458 [Pseudomonas synxantha]KIR20913.1 hypothetical protein PFLU3_36760 [Pseudomonas fluorescens]